MRFRSVLVVIAAVGLWLSYFTISDADPPPKYEADRVYELANQVVFYIRVFREDGTLKDTGTGFRIGADGTALTAAHVVAGGARISCVMPDGRTDDACWVTARSEDSDTAVLKLALDANGQGEAYKPLRLRDGEVRHGERVFAIGYPLKEVPIITEGIINSPKAPINGRDRMLVSSPIVSGMSGGPVLDASGAVVGVISGSLRTMNNIHLVIRLSDIREALRQAAE